MSNTHRVYWTEDGVPKSQDFGSGQLDDTLKYCEMLRKERREGKNITHITIASEMAECVSLQGVDVTDETYDWTKRRGGRS